jgi:cell wall-associated NlpC family hydrolase
MSFLVGILCALVLLLGSFVFTGHEADARGTGTGKKIVKKALSYYGTPYGFQAGEMSCSDLTRMSVGPVTGVWMPAWDDKQRHYGWKPRQEKPGDVLFWREYAGDGPVTHVGIYKGKGMVVHSSAYYGMVTYSPTKYIPGYLYARRIR